MKHLSINQVEKVNYEFAYLAVKDFEEGVALYTKLSHTTFSKVDNAPDVLRYLYRLYKRKSL
jgi:hypothetical protein